VFFLLAQFVFVFSNFVLFSVFSVASQYIGSEERLRNDLFCVECDVKPYSVQFGMMPERSRSPFANTQDLLTVPCCRTAVMKFGTVFLYGRHAANFHTYRHHY